MAKNSKKSNKSPHKKALKKIKSVKKVKKVKIVKKNISVGPDKKYYSYDSLPIPEDIREYLKNLYLFRKRRSKKTGSKLIPPTIKDIPTRFRKLNKSEIKYKNVLYFNVESYVESLNAEKFLIIDLWGNKLYEGESLTKASRAINEMTSVIDDARLVENVDSSDIPVVPVLLYKRKKFKSKDLKNYLVTVDYFNGSYSQEINAQLYGK